MTTMKTALGLNNNTRLEKMIEIKDGYLSRQLSLKEARALLKDHIGTCTPDEFAYGEQQLKGSYTDEESPTAWTNFWNYSTTSSFVPKIPIPKIIRFGCTWKKLKPASLLLTK